MKRPILYILIPFSLGIVIARIFEVSMVGVFCLSAFLLAMAVVNFRKNVFSHIALYLAVLFFGILYYQNSLKLPGDHIARYALDNPKRLFLKGVISDDPEVSVTPYNKTKTKFLLRVDSARESKSWRRASGLIDVSLFTETQKALRYGQGIMLEGIIAKPAGLKNPGLFDYSEYLAIKDIYAVFKVKEGGVVEIVSERIANPVKRSAYRIRNWMRAALDKHFEAPYSGFIKAIMIGDRTDLRYSLNADFIKTGTIHAIAISGLNVGLVAAIFLAVLALFRLPRKTNLVLVALIMVLYTFISGASPPIVRAVIIYLIVVAGYLINRDSDMLNSLALAAFLMLLVNPKELFDPSFQLSFVSITSMIVFMPKINKIFGVDNIKRNSFFEKARFYTLSAMAMSIAAWLGTWPIVARYFNIISPVALLANLVVVPALFFLTAASFLFLLADLFSGFFAGLIAHGLSAACQMLFTANHMLAALPMAYFRIAAPCAAFMTIYYAAIALPLMPSEIKVRRVNLRKSQVAAAILASLNILIWSDIATMGRDALRITFLDVGQGDSAVIESPDGKNVLIDAGPGGDEERFDAARSVVAPFLWNRGIDKLDAVIVTHFHEDHLGGIIYVLENFSIGAVMDNGALCEKSDIYDTYLRTIKRKNISRLTIGEGDEIFFDDAKMIVLNPQKKGPIVDSNDNSLVVKLQYKNFGALLCGDASENALDRMAGRYGKRLKSDVIKIPHHGGSIGRESGIKNFFGIVRARIAVISVAKMNKYRAPSQKTLDAISATNPIIYQTKDNGAVTVVADGGIYRVNGYKISN